MSILSLVDEVVGPWSRPYEMGNLVVVPTFHLYPSNGCVQVFVEGGERTFVVSDGGGALQSALGLGQGHVDIRKQLRYAARDLPVHLNAEGWLYSKHVEAGTLTSAISVVAECSRSAALFCSRSFRPETRVSFKNEVQDELEAVFHKRLERQVNLVGASNKAHKFDFGIKTHGDNIIVIDAVTPDANSINSAIVSHLDVKNAHNERVSQRLIYDDRVSWKSSDLSLLSVGALPIAYTRALGNLTMLAA